VYARYVDIDEYNSILTDDNAYIDDNHVNDDLNEQKTRFVRELLSELQEVWRGRTRAASS
jgi:hypothetical protein